MTELIIDDISPRISFDVGATATSVFSLPFVFFDNSDLVVTVDDVALVLDDDYTVTGAGANPAGTVTLTVAVSNVTVLIRRDLPIERITDFPEASALDIDAMNLELDRHIAIMQQLESGAAEDRQELLDAIAVLEGGELTATAEAIAEATADILDVRLRLDAPTSFYVATTGSNVTGTGSITQPWADMTHAYNQLQANYDFGGQLVTVNVADGTYTVGLYGSGPIVGQGGPTHLRFIGNLVNPDAVLIRPTNGYSFGAAFGAKFAIAGFKSDHYGGGDPLGGPGPNDMISVGQNGEIWMINPNPGSIAWVYTFGTSAGLSFNDMSAAFDGKIFIDTWVKYKIDTTGDAISTTGTWTSGAGTVTVPDASNIKVGMAIRGTGIYRNSFVVSKVGNVLTLNGVGTNASKTDEPITLTMSRQNHADVGVKGQIIHNTNGTPGYNAIEIVGTPHYYAGFLLSNGAGAQASFQTIAITGNCTGPKFVVKTNGTIDTLAINNDPATYLPGDVVTKTVSFSADVTDITLPSNENLPATATEVIAGNLVICSGKVRSPGDPSFGSATGEMTLVDLVEGAYSLGTNADIRLTRKTVAAGSSVTMTFVGVVGQGGQYN